MKKIMIVDDEKISNFIFRKLFAQISPDFVISDFTDPANAFQSIAEFCPDGIFLDINMPIMNGWSFLDSMSAQSLTYKVFILSSSTSQDDIARAASYSNVVNCVAKPLTREKLENCIRQLASA